MKTFSYLLLIGIISACTFSPSDFNELSLDTKSKNNLIWEELVLNGEENVKTLFIKELKQERIANAIFIKEKHIDSTHPEELYLKGVPIYRVDSSRFASIKPTSNFERILKLDTRNAAYFVCRQDSIILTLRASCKNNSFYTINEISNSPLPHLNNSLTKAFHTDEKIIMVEIYRRRHTALYDKDAYVFRNGKWVNAATGIEAIEDLITKRDQKTYDIIR